jgi:mono/diheme cytochrome c family protein
MKWLDRSVVRRHLAVSVLVLLPGCLVLLPGCLVLLPGCPGWLCGSAHAADDDRRVDFETAIRPLLTARCVQCHGNDASEGGLRLSDRETALAPLDSSARAIVPGKPDASELLRRVASSDSDQRMPPDGPALTGGEIELLRRWIADGAEWPEHWAYRPLTRPEVPGAAVDASRRWARTEIDLFVLDELSRHGLAPSPPADRRTWLRRVSIDLLGLPPSQIDQETFLQDKSPDAYGRAVDRMLASPRYGERWARHWMDVVHYAETHGHDQDRPREHAWPYRDYVIESLNRDKPYGRFAAEQVAGDVLYPDEPSAVVATGLLATGPWDESSLRDIRDDTLDRQIARYIDRDDIVTTVMSTFVSSTVHCARCHDHKFDPISQRDYYALQAVFAGTDKGNRKFDPDPLVARRRTELTQVIAGLPQKVEQNAPELRQPDLLRRVTTWEQSVRSAALLWRVLDSGQATSQSGATLTLQDDGSFYSSGERPDKDTYTIVGGTDLARITGLRLEVLNDERLPKSGPGRQDNGNLHLNELVVHAAPKDDPSQKRRLQLRNPRADFNQQGWTIEMALDANPATAWGIFPEVGKPHYAVFELEPPLETAEAMLLTVELQQTHGGGHLIGRPRVLVTSAMSPLPLAAEPLPGRITAILAMLEAERTTRQKAELAAYVLESELTRELAELPPPQLVYCGSSRFEPDGSFKPTAMPRPVHLLTRGDVTRPGPEVAAGALSCLPNLQHHFSQPSENRSRASPSDNSKPQNSSALLNDEGRRAALARWVADPDNVLTWRSIANRVWHYHFGRGLVDTPNDFGRMGSAPSHPKLLDWLACELRDNGGSLKALHRRIVTSAVYCQSSQHDPDKGQVDADNRFLWRMNRRRLDAESLRDAVLRITGTLDLQMGGPSVRQFIQTPGIHVTPNVDYGGFDVDDRANYRRSVYRFVFRTLPDPFMDALDCPDASQVTPRRNVSITPLQALAMLHDKFMVRQAQLLAERLADETSDLDSQVRNACYRILGRPATDEETSVIAEYASRHGLSNACRLLLNSNEFVFVD